MNPNKVKKYVNTQVHFFRNKHSNDYFFFQIENQITVIFLLMFRSLQILLFRNVIFLILNYKDQTIDTFAQNKIEKRKGLKLLPFDPQSFITSSGEIEHVPGCPCKSYEHY